MEPGAPGRRWPVDNLNNTAAVVRYSVGQHWRGQRCPGYLSSTLLGRLILRELRYKSCDSYSARLRFHTVIAAPV